MADKKVVGGYDKALIYKIKADWSAVVQADGTTTATTNAHASLELNDTIVKTTLTKDKLTFELLKNDTLIDTFIDDEVDFAASDVTPETMYSQGGTKHVSSSSSTATLYLIIAVGGTNGDGIKTLIAAGTLDADVVAETWENEKFARISMLFTLANAEAALSIINGLLPTGLYDVGATATIAQDRPLWKGFLAAA